MPVIERVIEFNAIVPCAASFLHAWLHEFLANKILEDQLAAHVLSSHIRIHHARPTEYDRHVAARAARLL
jgi:hypothetical protein